MALTDKLKELRQARDMTLEELATAAGVSKTYLSQLERDDRKKPSADVLMRIADALSVTLAELLERPVVRPRDDAPIEVPPSLEQFRERMAKLDVELSEQDLRELAQVRFRGKRPETIDDWNRLYLLLQERTAE